MCICASCVFGCIECAYACVCWACKCMSLCEHLCMCNILLIVSSTYMGESESIWIVQGNGYDSTSSSDKTNGPFLTTSSHSIPYWAAATTLGLCSLLQVRLHVFVHTYPHTYHIHIHTRHISHVHTYQPTHVHVYVIKYDMVTLSTF